eukprot:6492522-Amphidinium_carterae.1
MVEGDVDGPDGMRLLEAYAGPARERWAAQPRILKAGKHHVGQRSQVHIQPISDTGAADTRPLQLWPMRRIGVPKAHEHDFRHKQERADSTIQGMPATMYV